MSVPTSGEEFAKFIEYVTKAQECAYMLSHLAAHQGGSAKDKAISNGWYSVGELFKRLNYQATQLAQGKLQ